MTIILVCVGGGGWRGRGRMGLCALHNDENAEYCRLEPPALIMETVPRRF